MYNIRILQSSFISFLLVFVVLSYVLYVSYLCLYVYKNI